MTDLTERSNWVSRARIAWEVLIGELHPLRRVRFADGVEHLTLQSRKPNQ